MKRKFKYGSISLSFTIIFVAAVVLINVLAGMLTERFSLKYDMTETKLFDLSDQTTSLVSNLSEPITINILMEESEISTMDYYSDAYELMKRYAAASNGKITLNYVNVYKNQGFVLKYEEAKDIAAGSFIVDGPKRYKIMTLTDFFNMEYDQQTGSQYPSSFKGEQVLTSAVDYVTRAKLQNAVVLSGHGEEAPVALTTLLGTSNYETKIMNIEKEDIPEGTDLIVISAPTTDFSSTELDKLDKYMQNFGNLMVLLGTDSPPLSRLELYFEEWGVRFEQQVVLDPDRAVGHPLQGAALLSSHTVTTELMAKSDMYVLAPISRPVSILFEQNVTRTVKPLLTTSSAAYAKDYSDIDQTSASYDKSPDDPEGKFNYAVMAEISDAANVKKPGHIFFCGTKLIAEETIMSTGNRLNKPFLSAVLNYVNQNESNISIESKGIISETLDIVGSASNMIFVTLCVIIPLLIFVFGFLEWRKRRNM